MNIALERIANMRDGVLDLSNLGLTELPQLVSEGTPSTLKYLYCGGNQLTELPQLPSTLVYLYCMDNQLTSLPPLPSELKYLECENNQLTELPQLPSTLVRLYCGNNQLTSLPQLGSEGTPSTLRGLRCDNNPFQYPPPEVFVEAIKLYDRIAYIRDWMSDHPYESLIKSANKQ